MSVLTENTKKQPRGRPFQKGVSGNPGGRPKRTEEEMKLVEACKKKTQEALEVVDDLMRNGSSDRVRLAAAQFIIERGWGKAKEVVEYEPIVLEIRRDIDPSEGYLMMLDGGVLEALPDKSQDA